MNDLTIQPLGDNRAHSEQIAAWFAAEWRVDPREVAEFLPPAADRPAALIAVSGEDLLGALAYRRCQANFQTQPELWINALYVPPEHRRQGIARRLLRAGIRRTHIAPAQQLFVYTNFPELYLTSGWRRLLSDTATGMHTLAIDLSHA